MQKIRTCLQKTPNALLCALGAVVFLAGFYFLCYRTPLNEVWLPTTMNNDEALYNRQVVSVLTHGGPQGYFGYQESTADIGRYGTWGPLLIWAYALPGLLFGASVNVVLWCNLLLIAVGIAVFARCARLNYWQCIALCGALFSIMLPLRSCVSGASEAMHYMLALLIVGTAAALHRSGRTGWLIACAAACAVETIFRPYALLFWVFPLTAVWQNKRRRAACLGTAAGGFAVSLFAMAKLAAPYFSDGGMDFDGIRLLLQLHPVAAVRYECARAAALLHAAWRDDILPTLHGETTYIGGGCVTFLAVVLVAVVCLVWDKHKGRPLVLKACALFCSAVIALVLLFMYNIDPRHMMLLAILLLGGVFVYLLNDDDRGPVSPEMMDEAATGRNKSVYDTLDVLDNYLWRDVMKSAKADSAQRADREREAKERAEREKERKALAPMPATDQDVEAVEEMGSQPSQTVPTPSAPPQPSVAAPKIDKVTAPKVEAIGND